MTRFYNTNTNLSYPTDTITFEKECSSSHSPANGGTTHSATVAAAAIGVSTHWYGTSGAVHNSSTWPTTGWGVSIDVSAAGADLTYRVLTSRNDPSQNILTSTELIGSQTGTGIKSTTAQAWDPNGVGGLSANDTLAAFTSVSNSNMMSSHTFALYYSDSDSWIEGTNLVAPGGGGATLGVTTETDSVVAAGKKKVKALGVNTGTETPVALARAKRRALGVNTETETPVAVTRKKVKALGVATETDAAQPITRGAQIVAVNTVTETDTPIAVTRTKRKTLGVVTESDTAVALGKVDPQRATLGTNLETDTTVSVGRRKVKALGTATETESVQAVARTKRRTLGVTTETDTALNFTGVNFEPVSPATETDTAQALGRRKVVALGTALEAESAQSIGRRKVKLVAIITETDTARPISTITPLGTVEETDTAVTITAKKRKAISPATETSSSVSVGRISSRTVGVVVETSTPVAIAKKKRGSIAGASSVEEALALTQPTYSFEPPNFLVAWRLRHDNHVEPDTYLGLYETFSVVRKNGTLTQVKSPTNTELLEAGQEGRDWFLGGRIYTVSASVANELTAAGFTPVVV